MDENDDCYTDIKAEVSMIPRGPDLTQRRLYGGHGHRHLTRDTACELCALYPDRKSNSGQRMLVRKSRLACPERRWLKSRDSDT